MSSDTANHGERGRTSHRIGRILLNYARLVIVMVALSAAAACFGRFNLYCELFSHFQFQYFIGATGCLVLFLIARRWRWSMAAGALALYLAVAIVPWYLPVDRQHRSNPGRQLKLLISNVYTANTDHQRLLDLVEREKPDVVVLMEVNRRWMDALEPLDAQYPIQRSRPREDNFGIALFSKLPLDHLKLRYFDSELPSIVGRIQWAGQSIHLVATHPLPPIRRENHQRQRDQLTEVANHLKEENGPVVLVGDLNCTMWSAAYRRFMRQLPALRNSRESFGIVGTWPTAFRSALLRIPIEHCLVSKHLAVLDCRAADPIGSDHLPLIVTLAQRHQE